MGLQSTCDKECKLSVMVRPDRWTRWLKKDLLMQLVVLQVTTRPQVWLLDWHPRETGAIGE